MSMTLPSPPCPCPDPCRAQVTEAARLLNHTALGFTRGSGIDSNQVLAPAATLRLSVEPEMQVIVLAEDWG